MHTPSHDDPVSYRRLLLDQRFALILLVTATATLSSVFAPALPGISAGLGVREGRVGYLITAFKLPSILVIPLAAGIADIYGRRAVVIPSLLLFVGAGATMFFLQSFTTVLVFGLIVGVGGAALYPMTVTLLGDFFDGEWNSAGQGIRVAVIGLGIVGVPALTGYLAEINWNYPFLLFLGGLPVVILIYLFLGEPVDTLERGNSLTATVSEYVTAVKHEVKSPTLAVLLCSGFIRGFSRYALITFVPLFAVGVLGATIFEAGLLISLQGTVYLIVSPFAGLIVSRFARKWILFTSLGFCGAMLIALPFTQSLLGAGIVVALHTLGDAMFDPVNKGTVTNMAHKEYRAGIVNSLYVLKRVGQASAPAAFGFLLTVYGYFELFLTAGVVVGVYLVLFMAVFTYQPATSVD